MSVSALTHRKRTAARKPYVAGAAVLAALLASTACGAGSADTPKGAAAPVAEASTGEAVAMAGQGAQRMPSRVAALTWNICGIASACPNRGEGQTEQIEEIADIVKADSGYAVVLLQETCAVHSKLLKKKLGKNWVVRHRNGLMMGTKDRTFPCKAGVAVAMKKLPGSTFVKGPDGRLGWDVTFTRTRGLEHVDGKADRPRTQYTTQGAACLQDKGNKILACSSHFVPGSVKNATKIQNLSLGDLRQTTVDWQKGGYRTIVGGDFNIDVKAKNLPVVGLKRMSGMYRGNFEADSDNNGATHGNRKIDYIFFSDRGWKLRGGGVRKTSGKLSDHRILTAAVTVRPL
ncbi:endonuclease/exonuclease/phosphatase family protein [Streptomyces griseoflavus]|uniref:endonuclease/exonuclease/phosphatase family protein n=1 Tax=Streptomyces griseoflavus TaxID=35619 RepID=UPI003D75A730